MASPSRKRTEHNTWRYVVENDGIRIRRMDLPEFSSPVANRCATCLICIRPRTRARRRPHQRKERTEKDERGFLARRASSCMYSFVKSLLLFCWTRRVASPRFLTFSRAPFYSAISNERAHGPSFLIPSGTVLSCAAGPFYPVSPIADRNRFAEISLTRRSKR